LTEIITQGWADGVITDEKLDVAVKNYRCKKNSLNIRNH